jgi:hypothetical protein
LLPVSYLAVAMTNRVLKFCFPKKYSPKKIGANRFLGLNGVSLFYQDIMRMIFLVKTVKKQALIFKQF